MKKLCSLLTSTILISSSPVLPSTLNSNYHVSKTLQIKESNYPSEANILDFESILREAVFFNYLADNNSSEPTDIAMRTAINDLTYSDVSTSPSKDPSIKNIEYGIYFGCSILANKTDSEQTFTLQPFTRTVETEYTTEIRKGISVSTTFDFGFLNFDFKGDLSSNEKNTNRVETTITSPSQNVKVEKNQVVKASLYLGLTEGSVDINVSEDISGNVSANVWDQQTRSWHSFNTTVGKAFAAMAKYNALPASIKIINDSTIRFTGIATLSEHSTNTKYSVKYEIIN